MSLLYSILKPIVRKVVKGSSLHQEESYEAFKQASYEVQKKFKFALPKIKGFEFRDEPLDGFHIIVGKEAGTHPNKAVVYFPGGGSRRWQLPFKSSMKNYIRKTGAELWIPLYPLLPDYDLMEETEFTIRVHEKMMEKFRPENIVFPTVTCGRPAPMRSALRSLTRMCSRKRSTSFRFPTTESCDSILRTGRKSSRLGLTRQRRMHGRRKPAQGHPLTEEVMRRWAKREQPASRQRSSADTAARTSGGRHRTTSHAVERSVTSATPAAATATRRDFGKTT